jgi:hypothetical protein
LTPSQKRVPLDRGRTRLVTRLKALYTWRTSPSNALLPLVLFEFGEFPMTRKPQAPVLFGFCQSIHWFGSMPTTRNAVVSRVPLAGGDRRRGRVAHRSVVRRNDFSTTVGEDAGFIRGTRRTRE